MFSRALRYPCNAWHGGAYADDNHFTRLTGSMLPLRLERNQEVVVYPSDDVTIRSSQRNRPTAGHQHGQTVSTTRMETAAETTAPQVAERTAKSARGNELSARFNEPCQLLETFRCQVQT